MKRTSGLSKKAVKKVKFSLEKETQTENKILNAFKILKDEGYPLRIEDTFGIAVKENSDLETLKWLKEQGYPWDSRTFNLAVCNENLEILKWLKDQGCP